MCERLTLCFITDRTFAKSNTNRLKNPKLTPILNELAENLF